MNGNYSMEQSCGLLGVNLGTRCCDRGCIISLRLSLRLSCIAAALCDVVGWPPCTCF